jgi:hypothetical protein
MEKQTNWRADRLGSSPSSVTYWASDTHLWYEGNNNTIWEKHRRKCKSRKGSVQWWHIVQITLSLKAQCSCVYIYLLFFCLFLQSKASASAEMWLHSCRMMKKESWKNKFSTSWRGSFSLPASPYRVVIELAPASHRPETGLNLIGRKVLLRELSHALHQNCPVSLLSLINGLLPLLGYKLLRLVSLLYCSPEIKFVRVNENCWAPEFYSV